MQAQPLLVIFTGEDPDGTEPEVYVDDPFELARKRWAAFDREPVEKSISHVINIGRVR